jgi:hypothetical protein
MRSVAAGLEAARPRQRVAEDQAGAVVESFESLGVEVIDAALSTLTI